MSAATNKSMRVLIVGELDSFANGQKPREIEHYLRSQGHEVETADTYYLGRASGNPDSILRKLPAPRPRTMLL